MSTVMRATSRVTAMPEAPPRRLAKPWVLFLWCLLIFTCLSMASTDWNYSIRIIDNLSLTTRLATLEEGNIYRRIGLLVLGASGLLGMWRYGRPHVTARGPLPWACGLFLSLSYGSILWAEDPALVLKKLFVFTLMVVAAFFLGHAFSLRQIILVAIVTTALTLGMGVAAEIAHHSFQPWTSTYRFAGVMHPNAMAANCSVLLISTLALMHQRPSTRTYLIPLATTALLFLLLTKSRTASGAGLAGAVIFCVLVWPKPKVITSALVVAALFSSLLAIFSSDMLDTLPDVMLMGRAQESGSGTLSNRLPLWTECIEFIARKPLTGYGYQSFWTSQRTILISAHQGWVVPHSHNQFIEISLWIGVIGGIAYAVVMCGSIGAAYKWTKATGDSSWAFITALLAYWTLNMLLEAMGLFPTLSSFLCLMLIVRAVFPTREEVALRENNEARQWRTQPHYPFQGTPWARRTN